MAHIKNQSLLLFFQPIRELEFLYRFIDLSLSSKVANKCYRGRGSTGATGAWAPAEIFERVPGTLPEKKIRFKRPNLLRNWPTLAKD